MVLIIDIARAKMTIRARKGFWRPKNATDQKMLRPSWIKNHFRAAAIFLVQSLDSVIPIKI